MKNLLLLLPLLFIDIIRNVFQKNNNVDVPKHPIG